MIVNAVDTETVEGYVKIIADRYDWKWINSFEEIAEFLTTKRKDKMSFQYYTFNLGFDRDAILKYLPVEVLKEYCFNKDEKKSIKYKDFEMLLFGNKIFIIKNLKTKRSVKMIDIMQFFVTEPEKGLDALSRRFLNEDRKLDHPVIHNIKSHQTDWDMEKYFSDHKELIGEYCRKDAELTARLAELVHIKTKETLGIEMESIVSSAALGERLTLDHINGIGNYPKMVHDESAIFAKYSYHGGLFLTKKRGTFYNVTDIDISSAYPSVQVELPHWADGKFVEVKSDKNIPSEIKYGWLCVITDCEYLPFKTGEMEKFSDLISGETPIEREFGYSKIYYPVGKRYNFCTLAEYRVLKKYGYAIELVTGWIWRPFEVATHIAPFSWMKDMYLKKAEMKKKFGKASMEYLLVKIALNGTYGKTVQKVGAAKLRNWYYGSQITGITRANILEIIHKYKLQDNVINIATDGIVFDKFPENVDLGEGLGALDMERWDRALVIGNGMYQLEKNDGSIKTALRGISGRRDYDIKHELQKHRNENTIIPLVTKRRRPVHFKEAIIHHEKLGKDKINVFLSIQRTLNPGSDDKRIWDEYVNFDQLLEKQEISKPLNVSEIFKRIKKPELLLVEEEDEIDKI